MDTIPTFLRPICRALSRFSDQRPSYFNEGKKVFSFITLFVLMLALLPVLPGQPRPQQTGNQTSLEYLAQENAYQITEHKYKLDALASVPTDIALIKQRQDQLNEQLRQQGEAISQIRTTAFTGVVGIMCWVVVQLFQYFENKALRR